MIIKSAEFIVSNSDYTKCPDGGNPEFAFIGRSNVGKSSLINMITNRKGLAMTSSKPGKTTLINHFLINNQWYLVDLPGYGYARRSKEGREKLREIIEDYILERTELVNLFVLVDVRHEPQLIDLEFMEWLGENDVPFSIVFTKSDKLSTLRLQSNVEAYKDKLKESWDELPPLFITSSEKKLGRDELIDYIDKIQSQLV